MLMASLACLLKGAERVAPMLSFEMRDIDVSLHGIRQASPPKMVRIECEIVVDSDDPTSGSTFFPATCARTAPSPTRRPRPPKMVGTIRRKD
jgi:hypothetical protein